MDQQDSNTWGGVASGAASGASMGSAAGPWGTLIGGVLGGVVGGVSGSQKKVAKRPGYNIPSEIKQNLTDAQLTAIEGLPQSVQEQFVQNMQRSAQYSLGQAGSRKSGIAGLAATNQNMNDAAAQLRGANAQYRSQNMANLFAARKDMADYKDQSFQINQENPYYEGVAQKQAQQGAMWDSVNNLVNTGINAYGGGKSKSQGSYGYGNGGGYNVNPSFYNYNPQSQNGSVVNDGLEDTSTTA